MPRAARLITLPFPISCPGIVCISLHLSSLLAFQLIQGRSIDLVTALALASQAGFLARLKVYLGRRRRAILRLRFASILVHLAAQPLCLCPYCQAVSEQPVNLESELTLAGESWGPTVFLWTSCTTSRASLGETKPLCSTLVETPYSFAICLQIAYLARDSPIGFNWQPQ
jgi:hypothetical protein